MVVVVVIAIVAVVAIWTRSVGRTAMVVVIPAAGLVTPPLLAAFAIGLPAIGNPMLVLARLHPAARLPDMSIVLELPGARRPRIARPRRGHGLKLRCRRGAKIQIDLCSGGREGCRDDDCRGREKGSDK